MDGLIRRNADPGQAPAEELGRWLFVADNSWANLQVLCATSEDTSEYYEKGLMAPGLDIDAPLGYLRQTCDRLDEDGYVTVSDRPGLGYDIIFDYIDENRIRDQV
jgi:hypothetical protein